jgi:hypothetical protein
MQQSTHSSDPRMSTASSPTAKMLELLAAVEEGERYYQLMQRDAAAAIAGEAAPAPAPHRWRSATPPASRSASPVVVAAGALEGAASPPCALPSSAAAALRATSAELGVDERRRAAVLRRGISVVTPPTESASPLSTEPTAAQPTQVASDAASRRERWAQLRAKGKPPATAARPAPHATVADSRATVQRAADSSAPAAASSDPVVAAFMARRQRALRGCATNPASLGRPPTNKTESLAAAETGQPRFWLAPDTARC